MNLSSSPLDVWSATPTPFTKNFKIDLPATQRMIQRHIALKCDGVMLGGSCGEGPWLSSFDLRDLVTHAVESAEKKIKIAVQVTDNSENPVLERIESAKNWGADFAVLAQPYFLMRATPERLSKYYIDICERSPLPLIFYDRGRNSSIPVPTEILPDILAHPKIYSVKNSAAQDPDHFQAMCEVRKKRPELRVNSGDEFSLIQALQEGYDGAFFGGMILTAAAVREVMNLYQSNDIEAAKALDKQTQEVLFAAYGGENISCWLAGLKYMLIRLGVFAEWNNVLDYPLTDPCKKAVDQAVENTPWLHT
ncbi:MAG: dihydrodipicolinate synthase family protein [Chthoniobacterales bacterium]